MTSVIDPRRVGEKVENRKLASDQNFKIISGRARVRTPIPSKRNPMMLREAACEKLPKRIFPMERVVPQSGHGKSVKL